MMSSTYLKVALCLVLVQVAVAWLPENYQTRSALDKQQLLWNQILWEPYPVDALPTVGPSAAAMANLVNPSHLRSYFEFTSDERYAEELKLIHTYGVCAKARIEILPSSRYTGLFQTGSVGIARPSVANMVPTNLLPSLAFKSLIDGAPSVNFHTLYSPNGQGLNKNWFANIVSNVIEAPTSVAGQIGLRAFEKTLELIASDGPTADRPQDASTLGLYEQASVHTNGQKVPVGSVVAPWLLDFVPNQELAYSETETADFRTKLAEIPPGSVLYHLWAYRSKDDVFPTKKNGELIGHVVTESELIATKYCDQSLLFQHTRKPWAAN